jgi:NhaA family Na+:H+ antiporter
MAEHGSSSDAVRAGVVLLAAAVAALVVANSGLAPTYKNVLGTTIGADIGPLDLSLTVKDWIKNALMAVFFVFVGLEIKAEFKEGALAERSRAVAPFAGAVGGMFMPAAVFLMFTSSSPELARGWAIPSATDIAFAVGVVGLMGRLVSAPLRAFLLAVAVIDDLGAIIVIALFYTGDLTPWALLGMVVTIMILALLNVRAVPKLWPYLAVGALLWLFTLQSGINATLAGVITALFVPLRAAGRSPLHKLTDRLKAPVNYAIMPIFAFANAGVPLLNLGLSDLAAPLTAGIAVGLAVGKPIGITLGLLVVVRMGIAKLPAGADWLQMLGIGSLAGIGFTMSLFIGALAFSDAALLDQVRVGVLAGSLVATLVAVIILALAPRILARRKAAATVG